MKKLTIFLFFAVLLLNPKTVLAETKPLLREGLRNVAVGTNKVMPNIGTSSAKKIPENLQKIKTTIMPPLEQNKIENLKQRADNEINRRVTSLNNLISKINGLKKLTDVQKTVFVAQVQAQITNLNVLKTKIDADTDLTTLKTDVQSIVKSYRVYLLLIPQINILIAADSLDTVADRLDVLAGKLELRINTAGDVDVTKLKTNLENLETKTADIKVQAQKARDAVIPLTPDGYPGNKTILLQGRQYITVGIKDVNSAKEYALSIIIGLKGIPNTKTSTSSAEK